MAIVQARMTSTRLPGKVLLELNGKPMLWYVINRLRECRLLDGVIIATTTAVQDTPIVELAKRLGADFFRLEGEPSDVISRYYCASALYHVDTIVRITSDCPLTDPNVVDRAVQYYNKGDFDYVSTTGTYPDGFDAEVFSATALEEAWIRVSEKYHIEHVTSYFYTHPQEFRVGFVPCHLKNLNTKGLHLSVDTDQDLECMRVLIKNLPENFRLEDVIEYVSKKGLPHPDGRIHNKKL